MKITAMLKATMTHLLRVPSLPLVGLLLGSSASASVIPPLSEESFAAKCYTVGEVLDLRVNAGRLYSPTLGNIDELIEKQINSPHPRYVSSQTSGELFLSVHFESSTSAIKVEVSDGPERPWSYSMTVRPRSGNLGNLRLPIGQSYRLTLLQSAVPLSDRAAVLKPVNSCTE